MSAGKFKAAKRLGYQCRYAALKLLDGHTASRQEVFLF
jgi:hypothetical protein